MTCKECGARSRGQWRIREGIRSYKRPMLTRDELIRQLECVAESMRARDWAPDLSDRKKLAEWIEQACKLLKQRVVVEQVSREPFTIEDDHE